MQMEFGAFRENLDFLITDMALEHVVAQQKAYVRGCFRDADIRMASGINGATEQINLSRNAPWMEPNHVKGSKLPSLIFHLTPTLGVCHHPWG